MTTPRCILSLGEPSNPGSPWLDLLNRLHAEQPITTLLFIQGGVAAAEMSRWAHERGVALKRWAGLERIRLGQRPPCTGRDHLRAALFDTTHMTPRPELIVWGTVPAFWQGKRVRMWDVDQADVVAEAQIWGLSGWGWLDRQAAPFK